MVSIQVSHSSMLLGVVIGVALAPITLLGTLFIIVKSALGY